MSPAPRPWPAAVALALAAATSLGLARFSYALLLPAMRDDLGWSYFTAGAMNTVNAAGYLVGALAMPWALARADARRLVLAGGVAAAVALAAHGLATGDRLLYVLRFCTGVASAGSFVGGGLLAARLATSPAVGARGGLVLGLYYGGTGLGIVAGALWLPAWLAPGVAPAPVGPGPLGAAPWRGAWLGLALLAAVATALCAWGTRALAGPPVPRSAAAAAPLVPLAAGLAGYLCFGLGYIGYMTFIVTLLREQGAGTGLVTAFYALLGLGVCASSWLWARLLQHHRNGRPMALLNGLLALATALPVLSSHPVAVFASGTLFGAVFLSVVASTTALVRHNLPPAAWARGIAAFTIVFAAGQIVGPTLVGRIADGAGGLARGFLVSAAVLALGAVLALAQRALPRPG